MCLVVSESFQGRGVQRPAGPGVGTAVGTMCLLLSVRFVLPQCPQSHGKGDDLTLGRFMKLVIIRKC